MINYRLVLSLISFTLCTLPCSNAAPKHHAKQQAAVQALYQAGKNNDDKAITNIVSWCKEKRDQNPVMLIDQALHCAVDEYNDAPTTEFLTHQLAYAKMGNWQRYYKGITVLASMSLVAMALLCKP